MNSKQINIHKSYISTKHPCFLSSNDEKLKIDFLNPWFITGFSDAESSFLINVIENSEIKIDWRVRIVFKIKLHNRDIILLVKIQAFFTSLRNTPGPKIGKIYTYKNSVEYVVYAVKDLQVIIYHFERFGLISQKRADYELWKKAFDLVLNKKHITMEGLKEIIAIRAAINLGLSDELKSAFPQIIPVNRPLVELPLSIDPYWLAGFTSGEGSFIINIRASKTHSVGFQVTLIFAISQHKRDEKLLKLLIEYLGCGNIYKNGDAFEFKVTKLEDIILKIIPFFHNHPILGVKALDFHDWCKVAELMIEKKHLTAEGLEEIRKIKAGMNRGRRYLP